MSFCVCGGPSRFAALFQSLFASDLAHCAVLLSHQITPPRTNHYQPTTRVAQRQPTASSLSPPFLFFATDNETRSCCSIESPKSHQKSQRNLQQGPGRHQDSHNVQGSAADLRRGEVLHLARRQRERERREGGRQRGREEGRETEKERERDRQRERQRERQRVTGTEEEERSKLEDVPDGSMFVHVRVYSLFHDTMQSPSPPPRCFCFGHGASRLRPHRFGARSSHTSAMSSSLSLASSETPCAQMALRISRAPPSSTNCRCA